MIAPNLSGGSDAGRNVVFTLGFAIDPNAKATLEQFSRMQQQAGASGVSPGTTPGNSIPMWQGQPRMGSMPASYSSPGVRPGNYQQELERIARMEQESLRAIAEMKKRLAEEGLNRDKAALAELARIEKAAIQELSRQRQQAHDQEQARQAKAAAKQDAIDLRSTSDFISGELAGDTAGRRTADRATRLQERAQGREASVYRQTFRESLEGVTSLTRGFVLLTAAQGDNAEQMIKNLAQFEAVFQLVRGGTGIVQQASKAWETYAAARGMAAGGGGMGRFMSALGPVSAGIGIAAIGIGGVVGYEAEQRAKVKERWDQYNGTIAGLDEERKAYYTSHNERYGELQGQQGLQRIERGIMARRRLRQGSGGKESATESAYSDNRDRIATYEEEGVAGAPMIRALEQQITLRRELTREMVSQKEALREQATSMRDISQAMQQQIAESRKSAQEKFGDMNAGDQQMLLRLAERGRRGDKLNAQERQRLRGSGVDSLVEIADQQSRQAADAAGFNKLAGVVPFAQQAALGAIGQTAEFNIKLNTELKVQLEVNGEDFVRKLQDKLEAAEKEYSEMTEGILNGALKRFLRGNDEKRANAAKQRDAAR